MKLPQLNSAIRDADPAKIAFQVGGVVVHVAVQKTSLLEALKEAFPDRGETGLLINQEGFLTREQDLRPV